MAPKKIVHLNTVPEIIPRPEEPLEDVDEEIEPTLEEIVPNVVDDSEDDVEDDDDEDDDEDDEDDDGGEDGDDGEEFEEMEYPPDLFEILSGLMVTRDGETIADVLAGINENLDKHNKIMYKLFKVLETKR
jgi:hypothetical protein